MDNNFKKALAWICVILFLILTPVTILYSQGYRLDWNPPIGRIKITQTGGLFFRILPQPAEIFLDSKFKKTTDFLFGSSLIDNLLPKKYDISIRKEGYYSWEKQLEVKEKMVTAAESILLIPKNIDLTIISTDIENFWLAPDNKNLILKETSSNNENNWSLKLYNLSKKIKSHLIEESDIYAKGADLMGLEFSDNSKDIFLEIGIKEQIKKFDLEISQTPPILKEIKEQSIPIDNIITYKKLGEDIYYLDDLGYIFKTDSSFKQKNQITQTPFTVLPETNYELNKFKDLIFLKEKKTLYLFNQESNLWEKFFEPVSGLVLSPDSKKLVYFSDYEIWTMFLEDIQEQPSRQTGDKILIMRLSEKIKDVNWLNYSYLIITTENKIKISEIDERDKANIVDLVQLPNPKVSFNETDKKLYILSDNTLYQSKPILP
ncbi:MAG: hypothetical protein ABH876_00820 [Patescibacteria group bacterium]|nr:hypothetical protein [Patescibacteria group bacterium]MBU1876859.1 hypothetical protein [Patescibacteria group bacterium]